MDIFRIELTESREWESPNYTILLQKTFFDFIHTESEVNFYNKTNIL